MSDRHSPYNLFGLDLAEAIGPSAELAPTVVVREHRYSCAILPSRAIR